jgi:hypothetical protein
MTNFGKWILTLALAVSLGLSACTHKHASATIQESATHIIGLGTKPGDMDAYCTATSIGPHVLMTAAHCDKNEKFTLLDIDLSPRDYVILAVAGDGRDHILIAVDGPAFKNIAPYKTREAVVGESTYIWGDGEGAFPARYIVGKVVDKFDPSDVDAGQGIFYFSNKVIHGDSGSAIYSSDGWILGLVTYGLSGEESGAQGAAFSLNFTPEEIQFALNFVPEKEDMPAPKKEREEDPFAAIFGR